MLCQPEAERHTKASAECTRDAFVAKHDLEKWDAEQVKARADDLESRRLLLGCVPHINISAIIWGNDLINYNSAWLRAQQAAKLIEA